MKTYKFFVEGMHCKSCVVLTEGELNNLSHVEKAISDLSTCCVEVTGEFGEKDHEGVALELSEVLEKHGYKLLVEKSDKKTNWSDFKIAIPAALVFIAFFFVLQKLGIVNLANASSIGIGTSFFIGIIASLSTCMAVVGGLVLSVSANYTKGGNRAKSLTSFHIGRLVSFFILGGLIGAVGASFQLGIWGNFTLGLVVGIVMLILGLNLMDVFRVTSKLLPTLPVFISKPIFKLKNSKSPFVPVILGIATFFLPCGFTQSMQIYTLTAGSFINGALIMFVFALGTLPVLALLSVTSHKIGQSAWSGVFFKTAGIVVVSFAVVNILNSLAVIGVIKPLLNL